MIGTLKESTFFMFQTTTTSMSIVKLVIEGLDLMRFSILYVDLSCGFRGIKLCYLSYTSSILVIIYHFLQKEHFFLVVFCIMERK